MKKITGLLVGVMVFALSVNSVVALSTIPKPFNDVETNNFAFKEISWLKDNKVVQGYEDGTFHPGALITRAEFLKMVYEADPAYVGSVAPKACLDVAYTGTGSDPNPTHCGYKPFTDVPTNEWYSKYVSKAKSEGIISGYGDGTFKPDNKINFAEALKIVINQYLPDEQPIDGLCKGGDYNDERDGDDEHLDKDAWYYRYVKIADATCISDFGSSAFGMWGYLNVGVEITRADMAKLLYRALARSEGKYDENHPNDFSDPKFLSYCRDAGEELDNGRVEFPIAGEYSDLPFLGQLFTAMDYCGYQSAARLFGVEEGDAPYSLDYTLGSSLTTDSNGASTDFNALLEDIGFVCKDDTRPCENYELEDTVDIEKLFKLTEFIDEMKDDDCVNCG